MHTHGKTDAGKYSRGGHGMKGQRTSTAIIVQTGIGLLNPVLTNGFSFFMCIN